MQRPDWIVRNCALAIHISMRNRAHCIELLLLADNAQVYILCCIILLNQSLKMERYIRQQVLEMVFNSDDEDVYLEMDECSDGASLDSSEEIHLDERLDPVLDM